MTNKLTALLKAEGMEHLIPTLVDQGIVDSMLADLSESDLKSLGIDKLGERKRLHAVFANHRSAELPTPKEQRSPATRTRSAAPARRANRVQADNSNSDTENDSAAESKSATASAEDEGVNLAVTKKIDQFATIFGYCVTTLFFLFLAYGAYGLISIVIKFFN